MAPQMCTTEDAVQYPDEPSAAEVDQIAEARAETIPHLHKQIRENIAEAKTKQKINYAKTTAKKTTIFLFQEGNIEEKKNSRQLTRMGDTLQAKWVDKYRVTASTTSRCVSTT